MIDSASQKCHYEDILNREIIFYDCLNSSNKFTFLTWLKIPRDPSFYVK